MKIERLHLQNFRCFDTLDVEFHSHLTVLVAENGQGKSTILDTLRIALWPFVSSFDLARNAFNDPGNGIAISDIRMLRMPSGDMARQLPVRLSVSADGDIGKSFTWQRYRESEVQKTKTRDDNGVKLLKTWADSLQSKVRSLVEVHVDLPVFGYYGTGRLWSQKRLTETTKVKDPAYKDDFNVRTFAYMNCLDPASSYKHFKEWFTWAFSSYREQQIKQMEKGVPSADLKQCEERVRVVQQAIDSLLRPVTGWHDLEYSVSQNKSLVLHHEESGSLDVEQLSDGIRSVLAMVGDIAYRCIKLNPHLGLEAARKAQGVILIDEVDMHLHPRWQQVILEQLRLAFPCIQFIVTTHSPQVLTTVPKENIRIIRGSDAGEWSAEMPEFSPLAKESGDALAFVMDTHTRPDLPLMGDVHRYEQWVRAGQGLSEEALALKSKLDQAGFEFNDSEKRLLELLHRKANPDTTTPLFREHP